MRSGLAPLPHILSRDQNMDSIDDCQIHPSTRSNSFFKSNFGAFLFGFFRLIFAGLHGAVVGLPLAFVTPALDTTGSRVGIACIRCCSRSSNAAIFCP